MYNTFLPKCVRSLPKSFLKWLQNICLTESLLKLVINIFICLFGLVCLYSLLFFLQLYPTCLAQALYCCFCQAFPGSIEQVNDPDFLEYISNTTSEWIKGAIPITVGAGGSLYVVI